MKSLPLALLLFSISLVPVAAQNSGPSANGDFRFTAGAAATTLVFDAREQNRGTTRGRMVLTADQDPLGQPTTFMLAAELDCLRIVGNRAVMGGAITEASQADYLGARVLLVVEDAGEGSKAAADRFTWGIYGSSGETWSPTDAELEFDAGAGMRWHATDAEREDDIGIPSHPASLAVGCNSFAVSAYDLRELDRGAGNIQVKP